MVPLPYFSFHIAIGVSCFASGFHRPGLHSSIPLVCSISNIPNPILGYTTNSSGPMIHQFPSIPKTVIDQAPCTSNSVFRQWNACLPSSIDDLIDCPVPLKNANRIWHSLAKPPDSTLLNCSNRIWHNYLF